MYEAIESLFDELYFLLCSNPCECDNWRDCLKNRNNNKCNRDKK